METRTCKTCGKTQNTEEFVKAAIINGKQYYRWVCSPCYSRSKQPRKDKIRDWYWNFKKKFQCEQCGEDDFRVLDFDHKDRKEKSFNISESLRRGYSVDRILAEAAKCRVLCCKCHRIKTFEENRQL